MNKLLIHFDQQQLNLSIFFMNLKQRLYEKESLAISEPSPAKGRFLDRVINQSTAPPYEKVNEMKLIKFSTQMSRHRV